MHIAETFTRDDVIPEKIVMTIGGHARSGKGTSLASIRAGLAERGHKAIKIDQGLKFRSLTKLALEAGVDTADVPRLTDFLRRDKTQRQMLDLLAVAEDANEKALKALLYTDAIKETVGNIGENPVSHEIAVGLMLRQVAAAGLKQPVLIDGRSIGKYGRLLAQQKSAQYLFDIFVRCDSSIGARRVDGELRSIADMSDAELRAYSHNVEVTNKRNAQDAHRTVDPLRDPREAVNMDLLSFPYGDVDVVQATALDAMRIGTLAMDTTHTISVDQMTDSVTAVAMAAFDLQVTERERFGLDPSLWDGFVPYDDPTRSYEIRSLPDISRILERIPE